MSSEADRESPPEDPEEVGPADDEADEADEVDQSQPRERQQVGRYTVLGVLGRGGMGSVLEAFDRTLDRRVALKMLLREQDEQHQRRLVREAQALAKVSHPNIVQVYEVGEHDDQVFVAMELVRGQTLREWASREPRPEWRECVAVYLQVAEGLAAAHARGVLHRDFKPSNAVIDDDGKVRVLDFGLARKSVDTAELASAGLSLAPDDPALRDSFTSTGTVMGTLGYMPPEQMQGRWTRHSDQFSFCVSLYEALYGERPYEGDSMVVLIFSMLQGGQVKPAPKGTTVPPRLREVLLRGLCIDPSERWPSMDALIVELRRLLAPKVDRRVVLGFATVAGLTVVGVAAALLFAGGGSRCDDAAERLHEAWSEESQQKVKDAVLATGLPYAPETWGKVEERLDGYAKEWAAAHAQACETEEAEPPSPEVMDRRLECLEGRRIALRELVDVLARSDEARVGHAVHAAMSLPSLERCGDVEALMAAPDPPAAPDRAEQVRQQRGALARARALGVVGAYDEGVEVAAAVIEQARALEYSPLLAEALLTRGVLQGGPGQRYDEAERDLEEADREASGHGHRAVEAMAQAELAFVVGDRLGHHERGLQYGTNALVLARGPQVEPGTDGAAHWTMALLLRAQDQQEQALERYEVALPIFERVRGRRHPDVGEVLDEMGEVLRALGKLDDAAERHRQARLILEDALGAKHPRAAVPRIGLAEVALQQGDPDAATMEAMRALAVLEDGTGAPEWLAAARWVLARAVWEDPKQHSWARELAQQARDGFREAGPREEREAAAVEQWLQRAGEG